MVRRRTLLVVLASVALGQHAREPGVRHLQYKTPVNCTDEVLAWIENSYQERASEARPRARCRGDISEHLPLFRALCQDVSVARCAEVGVRNAYATWAFLSAAAHRLSRGEAPLRVRLYDLVEREEVTVLMRRLRGECPALDVKASARSAKATALLPGPIYSVRIHEPVSLLDLHRLHSWRATTSPWPSSPQT